MVAKIINGNDVSKIVYSEVKTGVIDYVNKYNNPPGLAVVLIGNDPASISYVSKKETACKEVGIYTKTFNLSEKVSQSEVLKLIGKLNFDNTFNGILVQLPLPQNFNQREIINSISPLKDVDGLTSENSGLLFLGIPRFVPATPYGILRLLKEQNIKTRGKKIVIVGRSQLVGLPLASILMQKGIFGDATVTVCHSETKNLAKETKTADILLAAVGKPKMISKEMISHNTCVIDVGVNRVINPNKRKGFSLIGDVDYENIKYIASYITPVPGGVGPMTVAMLLKNVIKSTKISR